MRSDQALAAIQQGIAVAATQSTAAAAEQAHQQRISSASRGCVSDTAVAFTKKRKRRHRAMRSRNSYVDAVLNQEEVRLLLDLVTHVLSARPLGWRR